MKKSTSLSSMLTALTVEARRRGLNDTRWCQAAGVRKETLSRLRNRANCDLGTLSSLAAAVGARLSVASSPLIETTEDAHFPAHVSREYESKLLDMVVSNNHDPHAWQALGPRFFMAGLAVMAASVIDRERRRWLALAEALSPASSHPDVFALWLKRSPVRPARFVPMLKQRLRNAA